jgi:UDP-N-acetylglucosamine--N-acetylmuramyl-(pentapeptide) pyrophosphoryl-undecaprenol N-acetylglucosamine transferase
MPSVYAAADLVVARSGALTLAEVAACGLPAILVPFPHAAGDHQKKNARSFLKGGAAVMIEEKDLSEVDLLQRAVTLMESDDYGRMRKKAKDLAKAGKPAVDVIAEDIINLIGEQRKVGS